MLSPSIRQKWYVTFSGHALRSVKIILPRNTEFCRRSTFTYTYLLLATLLLDCWYFEIHQFYRYQAFSLHWSQTSTLWIQIVIVVFLFILFHFDPGAYHVDYYTCSFYFTHDNNVSLLLSGQVIRQDYCIIFGDSVWSVLIQRLSSSKAVIST